MFLLLFFYIAIADLWFMLPIIIIDNKRPHFFSTFLFSDIIFIPAKATRDVKY